MSSTEHILARGNAELRHEIDRLKAELEQVKAERDRLKVRLSVTENLLPRAGRDY